MCKYLNDVHLDVCACLRVHELSRLFVEDDDAVIIVLRVNE